jgi:hypothetical protein
MPEKTLQNSVPSSPTCKVKQKIQIHWLCLYAVPVVLTFWIMIVLIKKGQFFEKLAATGFS